MYAVLVPQNPRGLRGLRGLSDVCNVDMYGNRVCGPNVPALGLTPPNPVTWFRSPTFTNLRLPNVFQNGGPIVACPQIMVANCPAGQTRTRGGPPCYTPGPCTGSPSTPVSFPPQWGPSTPPWGGWNPPVSVSGQGSGYTAQDVATAMQVYQSNPAALTPSQFALLQQSGVIASTLPYSSVSSLPSATSAASSVPTTTVAPAPVATTDFFSTQYGPLSGMGWLLVAGGAGLFLMMRKGR
jgi:hypothetical protein